MRKNTITDFRKISISISKLPPGHFDCGMEISAKKTNHRISLTSALSTDKPPAWPTEENTYATIEKRAKTNARRSGASAGI